ncbi:hypothetical protein ACKKBG_A04645 [Auxenochlorella protothecoides x Auxenochlorella symbiontica]
MAPMEELSFEDFPGTTLRVWLFTNVTNSKDVQAAMVEGTLEYEAAIMNAAVVPSLFAVHLAAHHALLSKQRGSLRTRSLHSELVCNLSGSKHIAESLQRFGVTEASQHLLVASFDARIGIEDQLMSLVQGECQHSKEALGSITDMGLLKKYFKCSDAELAMSSLEDIITCQMAARDL